MNAFKLKRRPQWVDAILVVGILIVTIGLSGIFLGNSLPRRKDEIDLLGVVQLGATMMLAWMLNVSLTRRSDAAKFERELVRDELRACLDIVDDIEAEFLAIAQTAPSDFSKVSMGLRKLRAKLREGRDFCDVCALRDARRLTDELLNLGVRSINDVLTSSVEIRPESAPAERVSKIAAAEQSLASFRRGVLEVIVSAHKQRV